MKIESHDIPVSEIFDGYKDSAENGVVGYGGRLNIRPAFQREFIYKGKQRDEVINTVKKGFPLNVMYWVKTADDSYELLDGQQRTISLCQYLSGDFSVNYQYFFNLQKDEQEKIRDYRLKIYICEGTDSEKLDWFRIINIAGEKLTEQELRNAIYCGTWLSDAKRYFSKKQCPAYHIAAVPRECEYLNGSEIRQDFLETALKWISARDGITIEEYMAKHQNDDDASELWQYFQSVINWIHIIFPTFRKEMKGLEWGLMFNKYGKNQYNAAKFEREIERLMQDDDIKHSGIYEYLLSGEEKHLNIRAFEPGMKRAAYERQKGICTICKKHFAIEEMEADHITPWHDGGKTIKENCQMLCRECNRRKSGK